MIRRLSLALLVTVVFATLASSASAIGPGGRQYKKMYSDYNRAARWHNANTQWHGSYAHNYWKQPMAMIAPPVANFQSSWSWGVGRTRMTPIWHQYTRPYVPPGGGGGALSPSPNNPPSTDHQGVYYIRGPW